MLQHHIWWDWWTSPWKINSTKEWIHTKISIEDKGRNWVFNLKKRHTSTLAASCKRKFETLHTAPKYKQVCACWCASVLPMHTQDWPPSGWTSLTLQSKGLSEESSPAPQFESISSSALCLLYGPTLTTIHNYWKNHSFDYMELCWQSDVSGF